MIHNYLKQINEANLERSDTNPYHQAANIAQAEDQRLAGDFDSHLTEIMTKLNDKLKVI